MSTPYEEESWSDGEVVGQCRAGDEWAWQELVRRYHRRLVLFCHLWLLRRDIADWNVAEDVAEKVLASLCLYDCRRLWAWRVEGRFFTYLAFLARHELYVFTNAWQERRGHERVLDSRSLQEEVDRHPQEPPSGDPLAALPDRPLPLLTTKERQFLEFKLNHPGEDPPNYKPSTCRFMMTRILKKFSAGTESR
jgi:DNA-directed RNA polymerase specialized sigma24 family protein